MEAVAEEVAEEVEVEVERPVILAMMMALAALARGKEDVCFVVYALPPAQERW